ncbi:hypothetical protein Barb4_01414 [Bacteroidales bacterium Barb4]|nr:hypothetical protein Barb4_01414 [Bacteroidales bacterium Barb4]
MRAGRLPSLSSDNTIGSQGSRVRMPPMKSPALLLTAGGALVCAIWIVLWVVPLIVRLLRPLYRYR